MILWGGFLSLILTFKQVEILVGGSHRKEEVLMNNIYMLLSIVGFVLYAISWFKPGRNYLALIAFQLTTLRLLIKIFDFENNAQLKPGTHFPFTVAGNMMTA